MNLPTWREKPFEPKEIISYAGELFRVRENNGTSGVVEYIDGELASNNFHWNIYGEDCIRVVFPLSNND